MIDSEEIPDDLQQTLERKPDFLKKVTDLQGNHFIIHLEFQAANDLEMHYRMLQYHSLLLRKYQLPVQQCVIYLGNAPLTMNDAIQSLNLAFRYDLVSFHKIDYRHFLNAPQPEEIILAILGDFGNQNELLVVEEIVNRVKTVTTNDLAQQKFLRQLRVLARLRKLEPLIQHVMTNLAEILDFKNDQMVKDVVLEEKLEIAIRLLHESNLPIENIAKIIGVSVSQIKKYQKKK